LSGPLRLSKTSWADIRAAETYTDSARNLRVRIWLAAVLFFLVSALAGQTPEDEQLASLREIAKQRPQDSFTRYRIGEILFKRSQLSNAQAEFEAAIRGSQVPKWVVPVSHIYLSKIYTAKAEPDRAQEQFRLAAQAKKQLRAAPDFPLPAGTFRVGADVTPPVPIEQPPPDYSPEAQAAGLEGSIYLVGTVGTDGLVRDFRVTVPLGFGLDEMAVEAVKRWRFEPGLRNDAPVDVFTTLRVDFTLPSKRSRWHLAGAAFDPPEGTTRPYFRSAPYPSGPGISRDAMDHAAIMSAAGRQPTVTLSFEVDSQGLPGEFHVVNASDPIWGPEAIELVKGWRFIPGTRDNESVPVPCTVMLVWGQREISAERLPNMSMERIGPVEITPSPTPVIPFVLTYKKEPAYSNEALKAQVEGTVILFAMLDGEGAPRDLRIVKSLGYGLDQKALEAAAEWRFERPLLNGTASPIPFSFEVVFRLPRSAEAKP
jgi:TonB family protein